MLRGDARKVTTSATSSASMIRCIEFVAIPRSTSACERPDSSDSRVIRAVNLSVLVTPGWTTVTLIPLGAQLVRKILGQCRHTDVADRVGDRGCLSGTQTADVDDPTPTLIDQIRRYSTRSAQVAEHFHFDFVSHDVVCGRLEIRRLSGAERSRCGVDQNVDAAELLYYLPHRRLNRVVVSRIRHDSDRTNSELRNQISCNAYDGSLSAREYRDVDPFSGQTSGDCQTDPLATTGNDRTLSRQVKIHTCDTIQTGGPRSLRRGIGDRRNHSCVSGPSDPRTGRRCRRSCPHRPRIAVRRRRLRLPTYEAFRAGQHAFLHTIGLRARRHRSHLPRRALTRRVGCTDHFTRLDRAQVEQRAVTPGRSD